MRASPDLIRRVIHQESRGNPNAVSPAGAMGLMQVMPDTARSPGFGIQPLQNPFDPEENRRFGTQYLNAMLQRYNGDEARALVAYNWGPGNADNWSGRMEDLPKETQGYLRSILGGGQAPVKQNALAEAPVAPPTNSLIPPPQNALSEPEAPRLNPLVYDLRIT